jgi:hypothetical protein
MEQTNSEGWWGKALRRNRTGNKMIEGGFRMGIGRGKGR